MCFVCVEGVFGFVVFDFGGGVGGEELEDCDDGFVVCGWVCEYGVEYVDVVVGGCGESVVDVGVDVLVCEY